MFTLKDFKVGQLWLTRDGGIVEIVTIHNDTLYPNMVRTFPIRGCRDIDCIYTGLWQSNGSYSADFGDPIPLETDLIELLAHSLDS